MLSAEVFVGEHDIAVLFWRSIEGWMHYHDQRPPLQAFELANDSTVNHSAIQYGSIADVQCDVIENRNLKMCSRSLGWDHSLIRY